MRLATDHSRPSEQAITEPGRTSTFGLRHVDPRVLRIAPHAAGRLVADWLAWSAQTGRSPLRIACLAPESMDQGELSAFGQALALSWPSAALDIATHPDPTAATLTRLAERVDDAPRDAVPPVASIGHSAHRPTRAHRTLLVASALAVAAVSAAVGMMAYRLRAEAHDAQTAALRVEDSWRKDVEGIDATLLNSVDLVPEKLKSLVARLTGEVKPVTPRNEVRQVLEELATLSLVLGDPEIHLASIDLSGVNVVVKVQSTLEQATEIANSLREIAGSRISTWVSQPDNERAAATGDGTFLFRITGTWGTPDAIKTASAVEKGKP
jgi:hypothetical protein